MATRALTFGTAVALAAAVGMHGCASGDQSPGGGPPPAAGDGDGAVRRLPAFRALDTDEDGAISSGEIDAAAAALASLDGDGDGRLSAAELRPPRRGGPIGGPARTPQEATAAFMAMDGDGDGALAGAELGSQFQSLVSRADADGDGSATEAEILALMTAEAEGPDDREGDAGRREAAPPGAGGEGRPPRPAVPLIAALDADGDGAVSEAEIASAAQALRALDGDGDGRLTPSELRPATDD